MIRSKREENNCVICVPAWKTTKRIKCRIMIMKYTMVSDLYALFSTWTFKGDNPQSNRKQEKAISKYNWIKDSDLCVFPVLCDLNKTRRKKKKKKKKDVETKRQWIYSDIYNLCVFISLWFSFPVWMEVLGFGGKALQMPSLSWI